MAVQTTLVNKPLNPRGNDQSPLAYNRAKLFSGKALDFDGVNDNIAKQTISVPSNNFSIALWTSSDEFDLGASCAVSIGKSGLGGGYDLVFYPYENSGTSGEHSRVYERTNGNIITQVKTTLNVPNLFVLQCTSTHIELYQNGILEAQYPRTLNITYDQIQFGDLLDSGNQNLNGSLCGTKLFNTALTAAQVADLYNNPEKVVPTGVDNTALKLWLPMQEGAGTTAYDGSGNGNHGTISGATYVHGIGAPVAQTAVIDWNKGVNELQYSEEFDQFSRGTGVSVSSSDAISPDGTQNADTITFANGGIGDFVRQILSISSGVTYTLSIYARSVSGNTSMSMDIQNSLQKGFTITNEWARYSYTFTTGAAYSWVDFQMSAPAVVEFWGAQVEQADAIGPYVRTSATAQTSPVLLPQGLTTGRDITGVNLFENVRKQGALNLDGNSWAEVHDNASLDFSSGMTLEAWIKLENTNQAIIGKWNFAGNKKEYLLFYNSTNVLQAFFGNGSSYQFTSTSYTADGSWVHFVGTSDGSTITPYVNGVAGTTTAQTTPLGASDIPVRIGVDDTGNSLSPNQIAQPRIYNRALTAEEVQRNYDAGKNTYTN